MIELGCCAAHELHFLAQAGCDGRAGPRLVPGRSLEIVARLERSGAPVKGTVARGVVLMRAGLYSNGVRLLMVHSAHDLSSAWQARDGSKRGNWEIGVNLFVYAVTSRTRP